MTPPEPELALAIPAGAALAVTAYDPWLDALDGVVAQLGRGPHAGDRIPEVVALAQGFDGGSSASGLMAPLRDASYRGFLREALLALASRLRTAPASDPRRGEVALLIASELVDAIAPAQGAALAQAVLALPATDRDRWAPASTYVTAHELLAEHLEREGDPRAALRHYEAVLAIDVDHGRALRGAARTTAALRRAGAPTPAIGRGLALVEGLEALELGDIAGETRYDVLRPLGRGRHAVVVQAYDRHVGRDVAIKRLLDERARDDGVPSRVLQARFFAEARTLARVRSPYVVALLDARPRQRFIALELCRGGNLRAAMRRGALGAADVARVGDQLAAALRAVHAVGAVHRDVKPANLLLRDVELERPLALADFGLAVRGGPGDEGVHAGTLRYLAPELRGTAAAKATPASDWFSAGVVLLELALAPAPLPDVLSTLDSALDVRDAVPAGLPADATARIRRLLAPAPRLRSWDP